MYYVLRAWNLCLPYGGRMFCVWNTYVLSMKDIKGRCFSERKHEGKVSSGIPPEGRAFFLLVPEVVAAQRQYATQESGQEIEDFGPHASPGSGMETIEISFHLLRNGDLVGSRDSGDGTVFGLETGGIAFPQRAFGRCDYLGAVPLQLDAGIGRIGLLQTCQYLVPGAIRTLGVFRAGIRFIGTCTPRSGIRLAYDSVGTLRPLLGFRHFRGRLPLFAEWLRTGNRQRCGTTRTTRSVRSRP